MKNQLKSKRLHLTLTGLTKRTNLENYHKNIVQKRLVLLPCMISQCMSVIIQSVNRTIQMEHAW